MAGARYLVEFRFPEGARDEVSVWAPDADEAIRQARSWIEASQRIGLGSASSSARAVGSKPQESDLGVARNHEDVYHRRFAPTGEPMSTLFHVEPSEIQRNTDWLRSTDSPGWRRLRELLKEQGVDPTQAALAKCPLPLGPEPPNSGTLVTADERVFMFRRGRDPLAVLTGGPEQVDLLLIDIGPEHWLSDRSVRAALDLLASEGR